MPSHEELLPLILSPSESLSIEYKTWLNFANDEHKAILAKAVIAIANEGGGHVVIGMQEERPNLVSIARPPEIAEYDQDSINKIIRRFSQPAIQCVLSALVHPGTGHPVAIISIPGGYGFPVMSKSGTAERTILPHLCYMRKPGPESAAPENQSDWERLLSRCIRNRQDELLDAIRTIVQGRVEISSTTLPSLMGKQDTFVSQARDRWVALTNALPSEAPQRCAFGRYEIDFWPKGASPIASLADMREKIKEAGTIKYTGWPPFWVPARAEIQPTIVDDQIECWLGVPEKDRQFKDAAHSDFWRMTQEGRAFLLRGYSEDASDKVKPGEVIAATLPILRIGEAMLFARRFSNAIDANASELFFRCRYYGLQDRQLRSIFDSDYDIIDSGVSKQAELTLQSSIPLDRIEENLPEIIHRFLTPLYERFSFAKLPIEVVGKALANLRSTRF